MIELEWSFPIDNHFMNKKWWKNPKKGSVCLKVGRTSCPLPHPGEVEALGGLGPSRSPGRFLGCLMLGCRRWGWFGSPLGWDGWVPCWTGFCSCGCRRCRDVCCGGWLHVPLVIPAWLGGGLGCWGRFGWNPGRRLAELGWSTREWIRKTLQTQRRQRVGGWVFFFCGPGWGGDRGVDVTYQYAMMLFVRMYVWLPPAALFSAGLWHGQGGGAQDL